MSYKKIAPRKSGLGKWYTLWLGDDHLLAVESTGYSEEYHRYYFKDLQAIITRRTVRGKILNAVFGMVLVLSFAAAVRVQGVATLPLVVGNIALFLMLWNMLRGPTCRCYLQTPLGTVELKPLGRIRTVRKVLETLHPLIALHQGELKPELMKELARGAQQGAAGDPPGAQKVSAAAAPSAVGRLHRRGFLLLLANALLSLLLMLMNTRVIVGCSIAVSLCFVLVAIFALVQERDHPSAALVRRMTWGGVAATTVAWWSSTVLVFFVNGQNHSSRAGQGELVDLFAATQTADSLAFAILMAAYAIIAAGLALTGLIAMGRRGGAARRVVL